MMQNLRILSEKFDVECLIMDKGKKEKHCFDEIEKYSKRIVYVKQPNSFIRFFNCLKSLVFKKPIQNGYFYSSKMKSFIKKNYKNYDCLFFMHMRTAQYAVDINAKKIIDCPDCITLNSYNEYVNSKGLRRFIYKIDYKNTKRFESTKYQCFNRVFVINHRDEQKLIELDSRLKYKIIILQNYVRDLGMSENVIENSNQICFLGRMAYGPNIHAINNFVSNIFPDLKKEYPDLVFNIYGGSVVKKIKNLEKVDGVIVHGYVENVAKEIQSNRLVVAPMISGSGTQNKILECMRLKKIVLTTQLGVDGLDHITSNDIVVCNDNIDFIEKCKYFLSKQSNEEKQRIENNAFNYVVNNFSFEISKQQLLNNIGI